MNIFYLKAQFDSIQVDGVGTIHVTEALSVGVHAYLLSQLEGLGDVLLPDALDAEVSTVQYSTVQYSTAQYSTPTWCRPCCPPAPRGCSSTRAQTWSH